MNRRKGNLMKEYNVYNVYYVIKMNGKEYLHVLENVKAANARVACGFCKQYVFERTGRNAFRPCTKVSEDDVNRYYHGEIIKGLPPVKSRFTK